MSCTLADKLGKQFAGDPAWPDTGLCIRRFHLAGVRHADLNARNILLAEDGDVYLVDFDRGSYSPGEPVDGSNSLSRLKRSLVKLWPADEEKALDLAWSRLLASYHG